MTIIESLRPYGPLALVVITSALMAFVHPGAISVIVWIHLTMGYFLVILSVLKLFDLRGFKDGFAKYDFVTKKIPAYGYAYPFIEMVLGLLYLGFFIPGVTYVLTIGLMSMAAISVFTAMRQGVRLNRACMGNVLDVPISTINIVENVGMAVLALIMLVMTVV